MSLRSISSPFDLRSSFIQLKNPPFFYRSPRTIEHLLLCKRRRRKRCLQVHSQFAPLISISLDDIFNTLISAFPSPNYLTLIAPALGFASGVALSLSSRPRSWNAVADDDDDFVGDWILFTSPTPFNRNVLLRCPSISFEDGGDSERLMKEERHYVNLSRGRIPVERWKDGGFEDEITYQRICIGAEDGGVISLDWPDNLDLVKEHGLDMTVLIVPGTTEGSMDRNVRMFVYEVLKYGCFPVVMNPRGCAGSPLTTPRLFTAADSDDICTAIQFINRSRPWTTLVSIGWGYGANMLTKYLGEVGEITPLTAAVCIDNPFDLEEATRSFPHHIAIDQKLTGGLRDILQANKELFQGKTKGFDVAKALSATSIRDFDGAVSMISYGFEAIEDFYSKSSTKQAVSSLKIPVLFIQSDDGTVPLFSIPRSLIAENPFTSLLLCSCLPSTIIQSERSSILWCQHLAIEWLSAVELALLKGRHPLLKDVDITINPSKGSALVDESALGKNSSAGSENRWTYDPSHSYLSNKNAKRVNLLKIAQSNAVNGFLIDQIMDVLKESDGAVHNNNIYFKPGSELHGGQRDVGTEQDGSVDALQGNSSLSEGGNSPTDGERSVDALQGNSSLSEGGDSPTDGERSQVLQTATVVMNMLDVTMPGTLGDEQKKKVLAAMEQGETLMKALQGAVPEDVRGKLTASVTEIVQTKGTHLNLDGLKRIGWIPNVTSEIKSKIQEKVKGNSFMEVENHDTHSTDQRKRDVGSDGIMQDESANLHSGDNNTKESSGSSQEKPIQSSEYVETGPEVGHKPSQPIETEKTIGGIDEATGEQKKANQSDGIADRNSADDQVVDATNVPYNDSNRRDPTAEQNISVSSNNSEEAFSAGSSTSENQVMDKEGSDSQKNGNKTQDMVDQNVQSSSTKPEETSPQQPSSNLPPIGVSQALDALTGFDDSTQMAVTSVFGVIENMIDHLEKESNQGNDGVANKNEDQESGIGSNEFPPISEYKSEVEGGNNGSYKASDVTQPSNQPENDCHVEDADFHEGNKLGEKKVAYSLTSSLKNNIGRSQGNSTGTSRLATKNINKVAPVQIFPPELAVNTHWESPYATYLLTYLSMQLPIIKPHDLDSTTDLFLDPEEGKWKMLNQTGNTKDIGNEEDQQCINGNGVDIHSMSQDNDMEKIIEPSYVIVDAEYPVLEPQSSEEHETFDGSSGEDDARKEESGLLIKNILLDALKVEVGRRLGMPDLKEIESNLVYDLEQVADAVAQAVVSDNEMNLNSSLKTNNRASVKFGSIEGEHIVMTISNALQDASHLRKVLPVGVIVGSSLASLRNYFQVANMRDDDQSEIVPDKPGKMQGKFYVQESETENELSVDEEYQHVDTENLLSGGNGKFGTVKSNNDGIMIGALTAALGASALLAPHQQKNCNGTVVIPSDPSNKKGVSHEEHGKLEDVIQEKNQSNLVSSFAEKAMSVAAPVVPTKGDGEVDHDRLVAILAELGQRGGILRLVGKIALLWGGIRGAMSLTDRLISFLHLAERPLFQRFFGFVGMVLVLWSPMVIPLLPALVQSWTTKASNGIAEYVCIIGLYVAIMILVMLWGRRVRGYENPLEQYGLDLRSASRIHDFLKGLVGGTMMVLCIHSINALLGYACLSWPSNLPSSSAGAVTFLKAYGNVLILAVRGIVTATGIATVEELLFRSWFPAEIAVELGYYHAIMISGIAFSLVQRSLRSVPGFLLLSLALFGAKERTQGKLYAPIGLRAGIMTTNFVLQMGGFLTYRSGTPFWLTSTHPWHPFDGAVGLSLCVILAIFLYPWQPLQEKKIARVTRE